MDRKIPISPEHRRELMVLVNKLGRDCSELEEEFRTIVVQLCQGGAEQFVHVQAMNTLQARHTGNRQVTWFPAESPFAGR